MEFAVLGLDTLARWQRDKELMGEGEGVRHYTDGYIEVVFLIEILYWIQRDSYNVMCYLHYLLQGLAV